MDEYEGTIYRDLVNSHDAVELARVYAGTVPPTTAAAACSVIDRIDEAIRIFHIGHRFVEAA
jgi:hypothetical protein